MTPKNWSFGFILLAMIGWWSAASLAANTPNEQPIAKLENDHGFYVNLTPYGSYVNDPTLALEVDEILASPEQFQPITSNYIDFGLTSDRIWTKFSVVNASDEMGNWRLYLQERYRKELFVYVKRRDENAQLILEHYYSDTYSDRTIPVRFLAADIALDPREELDIIVAYRSDATTYLPIGIGHPDKVAQRDFNEQIIDWTLNGALLMMILIGLIMTPFLGWRLSGAFCAYIFSGFVYVAHADSYTFQYLWPDYTAWNDPLNLSFMLLMSTFGLAFSRELFQINSRSRRLDRVLRGGILVSAILAILAPFLIASQFFMVTAYAIIPLLTLTQLGVALIALKSKWIGATPYFIGASLVVLSFVYALVAHLKPGVYNLDHTLDFGHFVLVSECLAFATAVVLRIQHVERQRDLAAQQELKTTKEKLRLTEQLQSALSDYRKARQVSDLRQFQLASVSHDLLHPLASLSTAINRMAVQDEEVSKQMQNACDYIEKLARQQLETSTPRDDSWDGEEPSQDDASEIFSVSAILDAVHEMFVSEAHKRDLAFNYQPSSLQVRADPVAVMRIVSNVVANAIHHTQTGKVLVGVRRKDECARIEIWDTGNGMSEDELQTFQDAYEKGARSDGYGIGMAVVAGESDRHNYAMDVRSTPGTGTMIAISIPLAQNG